MNSLWNKLQWYCQLAKTRLYYRHIFGRIGRTSTIVKPILLVNPEFVYIGDRVQIRHGARIEAVRGRSGVQFNPRVEIGDDTSIEQGFHLACGEQIVIGKKVAITEYVGVFDIWHSYESIDIPVVDQPLRTSPVRVGDHSLVGMGAVIHPGVSIGSHCLIGANSVVTKSFPDYSMIAGTPAKLIKRFSLEEQEWGSPNHA